MTGTQRLHVSTTREYLVYGDEQTGRAGASTHANLVMITQLCFTVSHDTVQWK